MINVLYLLYLYVPAGHFYVMKFDLFRGGVFFLGILRSICYPVYVVPFAFFLLFESLVSDVRKIHAKTKGASTEASKTESTVAE